MADTKKRERGYTGKNMLRAKNSKKIHRKGVEPLPHPMSLVEWQGCMIPFHQRCLMFGWSAGNHIPQLPQQQFTENSLLVGTSVLDALYIAALRTRPILYMTSAEST
jgi:hypothetical protein